MRLVCKASIQQMVSIVEYVIWMSWVGWFVGWFVGWLVGVVQGLGYFIQVLSWGLLDGASSRLDGWGFQGLGYFIQGCGRGGFPGCG